MGGKRRERKIEENQKEDIRKGKEKRCIKRVEKSRKEETK